MIHEIGKDFFMIRSDEEEFHRNIYLKRFRGEDGGAAAVNLLFDPGTKLDMAALLPLLKDKAGGIRNIHLLFLSHQDPDLTANAGAVMASAPGAHLICSVDTWRLVRMYGLPENRVRTVESFDSYAIRVKKTGQRIRFVPARYCHFRGAMMLYDYESRVLFSGDFLAGVNTRRGDGVEADEDSWEGIKLFHQLYMPSSRAVRRTVERIRLLSPAPEVVAPQHGDVIRGALVEEFLDRLASLQVGIDLVEDNNPEIDLVVMGINNFIELMEMNFPEAHAAFMDRMQKGNDFTSPFVFSSGRVGAVKVSPDNALVQVFGLLDEIADPETGRVLRGMLSNSLDQLGVEFQVIDDLASDGEAATADLQVDDILG